MSMLRHRFSNERWGGGGGGTLNHLPLLFGKVCIFFQSCRRQQEVPTLNILEEVSCLCGPTNKMNMFGEKFCPSLSGKSHKKLNLAKTLGYWRNFSHFL